MVNKELIKKKLDDIQECYMKLEKILEVDTHDIVHDDIRLPAAERYFQRIVDSAIDINSHIIAELSLRTADDYQSTFTIMGESQILPYDFAMKIAPSVGLRNAVIHQYEDISRTKLVNDLKKDIVQYAEYVKLIYDFLKK